MIMDSSKYIMFSSAGAERFAEVHGLELVDVSYFYTQHQYTRWKGMKDSTETQYIKYVDSVMALQKIPVVLNNIEEKYGTVGCVVKDKYGNLAAGTSTGGLMNKKYNRIGDSPVVGAGTYADNRTLMQERKPSEMICVLDCRDNSTAFSQLLMKLILLPAKSARSTPAILMVIIP